MAIFLLDTTTITLLQHRHPRATAQLRARAEHNRRMRFDFAKRDVTLLAARSPFNRLNEPIWESWKS